MKKLFLILGVTLVLIVMFIACKKINDTVTISTDKTSYTPMMSYGSGGIKMTPVFNSKKAYSKFFTKS